MKFSAFTTIISSLAFIATAAPSNAWGAEKPIPFVPRQSSASGGFYINKVVQKDNYVDFQIYSDRTVHLNSRRINLRKDLRDADDQDVMADLIALDQKTTDGLYAGEVRLFRIQLKGIFGDECANSRLREIFVKIRIAGGDDVDIRDLDFCSPQAFIQAK